MDKKAFLGGYAAEKLLDHVLAPPDKVDISDPASINNFVSKAPTPFSNNQLLMAPLVGAGLGGIGGYMFGNPKRRLRETLVGAVGGGLIGGGASLGYKYLGDIGARQSSKINTVPEEMFQQQRDNVKLLEDYQKSWNPLKGGLIEEGTGRPIANTELPHRIEKAKKLLELWPQIPVAAGKYEKLQGGIRGGMFGGVSGLALAKLIDELAPGAKKQHNTAKKDNKAMSNKEKKTETKKQADATAALLGGLGGGAAGLIPGAGAGGLYGLLSGAYQAEKGKKLQGALRGLGRGVVGGGLVGGGIGAGAGAGAGFMLPDGAAMAMTNPILAPIAAAKMTMDPIGTASRSALGFVGGGALGGYLGNKARKATLGEPKKDDEKSEEKTEKKDNKPEEKEERKAAAFLAALKEAELKLSPLAGMNKPTKEKGKSLNEALEKARKAREAKEKNMPQQNKAAADWKGFDYSNVGPGGLISWKTLPKSDTTARNWQASAAQPETPAMKPVPAQQTQLPMRAVEPAMKAIPQTSNAAPSAAPAATPAAEPAAQSRRFASPLTLERVLPGQRFAPMRKSVENATGGFFGDGPQLQKGASAYEFGKDAASTPAYRKAHKAQNRARYAALLKADGGRARSFTGANPALLDAHHYKYVKDRWASDKEDMKWDAADGGNRTEKSIERANAKDEQSKTSAYEFGAMVKRAYGFGDFTKQVSDTWNSPTVQNVINDPTTRAGLTYGGIGAGLGGLYGLVNPGEYEDETGNVRRRGRFMGALRGAAGGAALGGLAGAGAQEGRFQYLKSLMGRHSPEDANALPNVDRATALRMAEQFAQDNPNAVGALGTSPLQSANNAYSAASNAVQKYMPKRMGKAPSTGVDTPAKAPEVKKTDDNPAT